MQSSSMSLQQLIGISYCSFNVFCIVILSILLYATLVDVDRNIRRLFSIFTLLSVLAYCIFDIFWMLVYSGILLRNQLTRYISNILMYEAMTVSFYFMFCFLQYTIHSVVPTPTSKKRHLYTLSFIPFGILILIILTTPWTHVLFTIDTAGNFQHHMLYYIALFLLYSHILFSGIRALLYAIRVENSVLRNAYLIVTIYDIPVVIGSIIHFFYYQVPAMSVGITIALLIIYVFQMRDQVSTDDLTGVNNRKQAERFFIRHINEVNANTVDEKLYMFMIDVNKFKTINDVYGHAEGDAALVCISEVLKEKCNSLNNRCILSRFGGDEFVIGATFSTDDEPQQLVASILDAIEVINLKHLNPFRISLSIGYAKYKRDYKNLKTFLTVTDAAMYKHKRIGMLSSL